MTLCLCLYSRNSIRRKKNKIGALKKVTQKNTTVKITLTIKINDEIRSRIFVFRNQKQNLIVADIFKIEAYLLLLSHSLSRFTPSYLKKNEEKVECSLSVSASIRKNKKIMRSRFSLSYVCSNRGAPRFSKVFRSTASARTLAHSVHCASHLPSSPALSLSQSSESY